METFLRKDNVEPKSILAESVFEHRLVLKDKLMKANEIT